MSDNVFTLESIHEAANQRFGSMTVEFEGKTTVLASPLRIAEAKRNQVFDIIDEIQAASEGDEEASDAVAARNLGPQFRQFLTLVGDKNTPALLKALGDDLGLLVALFEKYQAEVGLGEA